MKQNLIETLVGFIIIIIALIFFIFAYKVGNSTKITKGYVLTAAFQDAEGINNGSDVTLAGIKIGAVTKVILDPTSFFALLTLNIHNDIKLPKDTSLAISSSGFLGGKYIAVIPGLSEEFLSPNDEVKYTQSSINMESIIGKLIYSFGGNKK